MNSPDTTPRASAITPLGEGGIGIIALVGPGAADVLDAVFVGTRRGAHEIAPGTIAHGVIRENDRTVDEVIVACLDDDRTEVSRPRYEINCHGGVMAVRAVLDCLRGAGAKVVGRMEAAPAAGGPRRGQPPVLSEPGVRRRALALLPRAMTRLAAGMLLHQAEGALRRELVGCVEAWQEGRPQQAERVLAALQATARLGLALTDPPAVAIAGPPNAGKSTLLNALLRRERVLVHERPGTTRDVVAETVSIRGVPFELMDTAGIRTPEGRVEADAVGRATRLVEECDTVLLVYDVREGPGSALESVTVPAGRTRVIPVCNKIDLVDGEPALEGPPAQPAGSAHVAVSARDGTHIEKLEEALLAPYADALARCRKGGGVIFHDDVRRAVEELERALRQGDDGAARRLGLNQ